MPDESPEVIEQQMSDTRDALSLKVSALENQVVDTIQSATTSVSNIVDQVKTAVPESIASVKESISDVKHSISEQLKDSLDISKKTRENPLAMIGGAAAVGFITGLVLFRRPASVATPSASAFTGPTQPQSFAVSQAVQKTSAPMKLPSWLEPIVDRLGEKVSQEVRKLGEVAIAAASSTLQQTVEKALPNLLTGAADQSVSTNAYPVRNGVTNLSAR